MIQFTRDEEVRLGDAGYEIIVWGVVTDVPCDYEDRGCPGGPRASDLPGRRRMPL